MPHFCEAIRLAWDNLKAAYLQRRCTHPNIDNALDIPLGLAPDVWHTIASTVTCPDCGKTFTLSASVKRTGMSSYAHLDDEP